MFKVLMCGSRDWKDKGIIRLVLDDFDDPNGTLIHGAARGADYLASKYAEGRGWVVRSYPARWDLYGRSAGPIRNREMFEAEKDGLDLVVAFRCEGVSRGTDDMCEVATEGGVEVTVIREEDL